MRVLRTLSTEAGLIPALAVAQNTPEPALDPAPPISITSPLDSGARIKILSSVIGDHFQSRPDCSFRAALGALGGALVGTLLGRVIGADTWAPVAVPRN